MIRALLTSDTSHVRMRDKSLQHIGKGSFPSLSIEGNFRQISLWIENGAWNCRSVFSLMCQWQRGHKALQNFGGLKSFQELLKSIQNSRLRENWIPRYLPKFSKGIRGAAYKKRDREAGRDIPIWKKQSFAPSNAANPTISSGAPWEWTMSKNTSRPSPAHDVASQSTSVIVRID